MVEDDDRTRVEASGVLLLRATSMCKLTHKGHQQYAKGDGHAFEDYLLRAWPAVSNRYGMSYNYPKSIIRFLSLTLTQTQTISTGVWAEQNTANDKIGYVRRPGNFTTLLNLLLVIQSELFY